MGDVTDVSGQATLQLIARTKVDMERLMKLGLNALMKEGVLIAKK